MEQSMSTLPKPIVPLTEDQKQVVENHIWMADWLAKNADSPVQIDDLIQACRLALIRAVQRFDPSRGIKFKTFASNSIRGAILDAAKDLPIVHIPWHKKAEDSCRQRKVYGLTGIVDELATEKDLDETLDREQWHDRFAAAVEMLPDNQRSVIDLRRKGILLKEAGKMLGFSSHWAAKLEKRAIRAIQERLPSRCA
jgi:RNA polymerase sigma factor (sigma-70 family)